MLHRSLGCLKKKQFLLFHRFQKAQSFCELKFALFVPRIYSLSSSSAISERIGESPVCDVS